MKTPNMIVTKQKHQSSDPYKKEIKAPDADIKPKKDQKVSNTDAKKEKTNPSSFLFVNVDQVRQGSKIEGGLPPKPKMA